MKLTWNEIMKLVICLIMYLTILQLYVLYILYAQGAAKMEVETSSSGLVGADDLLIVGPGVLGRLIAQLWRQVLIFWYLLRFKIVQMTKFWPNIKKILLLRF